jgi:hypothetical protein
MRSVSSRFRLRSQHALTYSGRPSEVGEPSAARRLPNLLAITYSLRLPFTARAISSSLRPWPYRAPACPAEFQPIPRGVAGPSPRRVRDDRLLCWQARAAGARIRGLTRAMGFYGRAMDPSTITALLRGRAGIVQHLDAAGDPCGLQRPRSITETDSALEEAGFELLVPQINPARRCQRRTPWRRISVMFVFDAHLA